MLDLIDKHLKGTMAEVARLMFVDGRTPREISEQLSLTPHTVNRYKRDAIARLRAHLARPP